MKLTPRRAKPRRAGRVTLLGPQALEVTLDRIAPTLPEGPIATITAGWQERESEDAELDGYLGGRSRNLELYRRSETLSELDPELHEAHRATQDRLKLLRRAYNVRLAHLMGAWSELVDMLGDDAVLRPERESALEAIRALDSDHLARVREIRLEYENAHRPGERYEVVRQRTAIDGVLDGAETVVIAGGHVAVLLNRLNLFGMGERLAGRTIVAWSAGAMALAGRVVLFHDQPPQGPGHAEVLEHGLDLYPTLLPFPYARQRLDLDDRARSGRLARRFAPARCAVLDAGTRLEWAGRGWRPHGPAQRISEDGRLADLRLQRRSRRAEEMS